MAPAFIFDDAAWIRQGDTVELYLASVEVIDHLRTYHLEALGVPSDVVMLSLWRQAGIIHRQCAGAPDDVERPVLFVICAQTGLVLDRWMGSHRWDVIAARLRQVTHAA